MAGRPNETLRRSGQLGNCAKLDAPKRAWRHRPVPGIIEKFRGPRTRSCAHFWPAALTMSEAGNAKVVSCESIVPACREPCRIRRPDGKSNHESEVGGTAASHEEQSPR